mgnify:FL=1
MVNPLYGPSFVDVVADAKPEAVGFDKPITVDIETFDGFTYNFKIGIKRGDENNMYFGYSVDAKLVKEPRTPRKDEKAEDKDKLDKEHDKKFADLELRYAKEKALSKWVYVVETKPFIPFTRERSAMIDKPEPKKDGKK